MNEIDDVRDSREDEEEKDRLIDSILGRLRELEIKDLAKSIAWLYQHAQNTEWLTRNSDGEDRSYCSCCATEEDRWWGQKEHRLGCEYIMRMEEIKEWIEKGYEL